MSSSKQGSNNLILAFSNCNQFQKEMSKYSYFELTNAASNEKFKKRLLQHENGESILEIVQASGDKSMLVGNTVSSLSSFLMFQEVDPLLLVVPVLNLARGTVNEEKKGYFKQLDEIFTSEDKQQIEALNILIKNKRILRNLSKISDSQNHGDEESDTFFRLNNEKLKIYLDHKIEKAQAVFSKNQENLQFYKISTKEEISDSLYFGIEFLYSYLSPDLFQTLVIQPRNLEIDQFFNFKKHRDIRTAYDHYSNDPINNNNKNNNNEEESSKKKKQESTVPKITAVEVKNMQAAKNTKTLFNFFKKK